MPLKTKICGLKKKIEVETAIKYGAAFCGFILNYPSSHRHIKNLDQIKFLTNINNKNTQFVAVLVNPTNYELEKIKNFNFQFVQLHGDENLDCIKKIKEKYKFKIIKTIKIKREKDILKYKFYEKHVDIILFDSAGYERSEAFEHKWLEQIEKNTPPIMIAGKINEETKLESISKIADYVDISGGLETNKEKDLAKIKNFLLKIKNL